MKVRYELTNYRLLAGLSITKLADKIGTDEETLRRWEAGLQTPHPHYIGELCKFFKVDHPKKLNLDAQFNHASTQSREDEIIEMLKDKDRREILVLLAQLPAFMGVDLTALFSTTVVAPEDFLSVCRAVIDECWQLFRRNGYDVADSLLLVCIPRLESLTTHLSKYQHDAASLVVEAQVIQIIIATRKLDYARRKTLGLEVVHFGEMSGDCNMHAMALGWHGDTYKTCYRQPKIAIPILNDAIPLLNDETPLNKADIYMSLAASYAQDDNEKLARDYAEQAHIAMPDNPEADPLYRCIRTGQSELDQREGNMYLILAKRFSSQKEYGQKAYDALIKSTSKQAMSTGNRNQALITQADAARAIGDMRQYFDCLEEGLRMALQRGDQRNITRAIAVIQKAPMKWRTEKQYTELQKIIREIMTPTKIQQ